MTDQSLPSSDIWHDVCLTCHPDMDLAICGTPIEYSPDESNTDIPEGQDCVVCMGMICVTCPDEPGIIGRIGDSQ